jgi:hypothetical protein
MVTFGSTSETSTELRKYTRDLYARLEAETGQATGLQAVRLHRGRGRRDRLEEYRRVSAFNRYCGIDVHEISPREVKRPLPARARRRPARGLLRQGRRPRRPGRRHHGAREGRAAGGRDARRGRRRHGGVTRASARGHRCHHHRTATSRASTSSTAPACGRASSGEGRRHIPNQAAEHYYLITEARCPASRPEVAGARGPGLVRLLPRGGRRPDDRPLRAGVRAVEGRGHPSRTSRSARSRPTGIAWARTSRRR